MSVISLDDARKKLAKRLKSDSPSKLNTPWDEHGQTPTELDENTEIALLAMYEVLIEAWAGGFTTKSKFARESANIIAVAATDTHRLLTKSIESCIAEVTRARLQHQTRHCLPTGDIAERARA